MNDLEIMSPSIANGSQTYSQTRIVYIAIKIIRKVVLKFVCSKTKNEAITPCFGVNSVAHRHLCAITKF